MGTCVQGQPVLHTEFQDSQGYKERPCIKKQNKIGVSRDKRGLLASQLVSFSFSERDPVSKERLRKTPGIDLCVHIQTHTHSTYKLIDIPNHLNSLPLQETLEIHTDPEHSTLRHTKCLCKLYLLEIPTLKHSHTL